MRGLRRCVVLVAALFPVLAHADQPQRLPPVRAVRTFGPIQLDGKLDEPTWQRPGIDGFLQRDPDEGKPATQRTEVWVAYDDEALYVAARMYDPAPDSIMNFLARRDEMPTTDYFAFFVDPYFDHRTGYYFVVSAGGSLGDGTLYNDDWDDDSWDGIWEAEARIDSVGWTAEMRIPFSQLRFHQLEKYRWGVDFKRVIGRKNESDYLVYTPKKESGFVSRFVDLVGIENVEPPRLVEVTPYVNTKAEYLQSAAGDPFRSGSRYLPGLGADFKVGISHNLTLVGTLNPDFGQVEVDPAVVNLSDVETFYQEKRPFFVEGSNIFNNFGYGGANNFWGFNWAGPELFYSRRIGRAPAGDLPNNDYADVPDGTRILGAAKLTGKLGDSWTLGTAHALTAREFARISLHGVQSSAEVEPLAYYSVTRLQKEFNDGRQGLGGIATVTARSFSDQRLRDDMNSHALATGLDGWTFLDEEKVWVIGGWTALSNVAGTATRMLALQQNSQHYFQRPDARYFHVDSSRTSLTGYAGRLYLNKQKGNVILNAALGVIDPRFDINDLGFQWRTDQINMHVGSGYQWTEPGALFRQAEIVGAFFQTYDYDGDLLWRGVFQQTQLQFLNYWELRLMYAFNPRTYSNNRTRGGPVMATLPGREYDFQLSTDGRKPWVVDASANSYWRTGEPSYSFDVGVNWRPSPNISFRVGPGYSFNRSVAQWVDAFADPTATVTYGSRYVFATLNQKTVSASIRLDWTFTPQLSLQLYAQPLISAGEYNDFKELSRPRSFDFLHYGTDGSTLVAQTDASGHVESYTADPDGSGPAQPLTFSNPDFNFKSLRGNMVLRWEFRPGSTLYLVWTQSRTDDENIGQFRFNRSLRRLGRAQPDNILMLKLTYWIPL